MENSPTAALDDKDKASIVKAEKIYKEDKK